jgi:hypothetical protein
MVLMGCHACRRRGYCLGRWEQAHFFGFLVVKQQRHEPQYNFICLLPSCLQQPSTTLAPREPTPAKH